MRSIRSAAVAITALLIIATNVQAYESADEPVVATELRQDTPITAEDVEVLSQSRGISEAEAHLRLRIERAGVGLEARLTAAFPDTFGGVWLTREGSTRLAVALTDDAEAALPVARAQFAIPEIVDTIAVDHSLADLVALQDRMAVDREAIRSGALPFSGLHATGGTYDLDIDVMRNTVVVRLPAVTGELQAAFGGLYGTAMLEVEDGASEPDACTRLDCRHTMMGGLQVYWNQYPCSSAFTAVGGSNYFVLTAGHCGGDGATWYHAGSIFGIQDSRQQIGYNDSSRIRKTDSRWYMKAAVFVQPTELRPVRYYISWESTLINTEVGKAGITTNTTRGVITSKYGKPGWVPWSDRFLVTNYCAETYDSGGSVFNGNTAYGIHSGSTLRTCAQGGDTSLFSNIVYAQNALGVTILASP